MQNFLTFHVLIVLFFTFLSIQSKNEMKNKCFHETNFCPVLVRVVQSIKAPEVMIENGHDTKVDIWSLGITAIELATGRVPHSELEPMQLVTFVPANPPPRLGSFLLSSSSPSLSLSLSLSSFSLISLLHQLILMKYECERC
jgi:serine/threonine protein kinase